MNIQTDFKTNVEEILFKLPVIRREKLVSQLVELNKGIIGFSKPTVESNLSKMVEEGLLKRLTTEEALQIFGIKNEDKRASFITLTISYGIKEHIDLIMKYLENGSPIEVKMALKEIEIYSKRYALSPKQLDILVKNMSTKDFELLDMLLRITNNEVFKKGIEPYNTSKFIEILKSLLKNIPPKIREYPNLRTHIIFFLGKYEQDIVIDQLRKDATNLESPEIVQNDYIHSPTAKIIEKHRTELFNLELQLRKDEKKGAAQFISQIRFKALTLLGISDSSFGIEEGKK
ncbi:MAG: hypothetical protein WCV90_07255 [Candidatus Woesearchaeota archaeon]